MNGIKKKRLYLIVLHTFLNKQSIVIVTTLYTSTMLKPVKFSLQFLEPDDYCSCGLKQTVSSVQMHNKNVPGFLPDSDLFAALWRFPLEAATFVGSWGGRQQQGQGEVGLTLGGERRQEAHLCTVYHT